MPQAKSQTKTQAKAAATPAGLAPAPGQHPAFAAARAHALAVAGGVKQTVAGCVALGLELLRLQVDLGYVHGRRRGDWPRPALPWTYLLPQETGFSYDRCRTFMRTAAAVQQRILASRKKGDASLRTIVQHPPAAWTQVDYCAFADAIGQHFECDTFKELMGDLGLLRPAETLPPAPAGDDPAGGDPYTAVQAAHDCVAGPIIGLHRTMAAPEQFTRHLYELPLADQPGDRAAGIPAITGLMTLQTVLTQAQAQIAKAIADKRKGGGR